MRPVWLRRSHPKVVALYRKKPEVYVEGYVRVGGLAVLRGWGNLFSCTGFSGIGVE